MSGKLLNSSSTEYILSTGKRDYFLSYQHLGLPFALVAGLSKNRLTESLLN